MTRTSYKKGMAAALGCAFLWGILPVYWRSLEPIPSDVIIFYRIVLVGVFSLIWSLKKYGAAELKKLLKNKKSILKYTVAGILITGNWSIYIWAVNAGYIVQTSVGYYMEPLVVCAFGIVIFKERLTAGKAVAFVMAIIGILILIWHFGEVPSIALGLAFTFAFYAAIKKICDAPPIVSLFCETVFLIIPALLVILFKEFNSTVGIAAAPNYKIGLLMLSGLMTIAPLGLFAYAAKNIPLVTLGITEYVSPTIALVIGLLYGETVDRYQVVSFVIIWIGLAIFTYGEYSEYKTGEKAD